MQTARMSADCASKLRVLGDPTRMRVAGALMDRPLCVHELIELLDVEQSLMSHHLRVMRDAGLVQGVRTGKAMRYELTGEVRSSALDLGCCRLTFESKREGRKR